MKAPPFHCFNNRPPSPPIEPPPNTQRAKVLALLKKGQKITHIDAWDILGIWSFRECIYRLKIAGWPIVGVNEPYKTQSGKVVNLKRHHLELPSNHNITGG